MRFHNCTGSYIFRVSRGLTLQVETIFFVIVCYLQPDGNRSEEIKTWTLSKSIKKEILRDDQFFIRDAQPTKKMNTLFLLFFFYGVGWRSFGMKRSHSPMNMTANISSSWMICPNERIPVTCQSFTMAAPFVSFGLSRRSDVVEQAFRRNKETRKKDKRVNDSISIRHAYIYYITNPAKVMATWRLIFLFSLPRGRRGGWSFMLMTTERGKHTCSKTNKKGKKKKKNGQLMATRKQVGSIEKYTQSLLTCTTHTHTHRSCFYWCSPYIYTTTVVQMSVIEEEEEICS
jgi:hypothetical protein